MKGRIAAISPELLPRWRRIARPHQLLADLGRKPVRRICAPAIFRCSSLPTREDFVDGHHIDDGLCVCAARWRISPSASADSVVSWAGLMTMGPPSARAGPTLRVIIGVGKFARRGSRQPRRPLLSTTLCGGPSALPGMTSPYIAAYRLRANHSMNEGRHNAPRRGSPRGACPVRAFMSCAMSSCAVHHHSYHFSPHDGASLGGSWRAKAPRPICRFDRSLTLFRRSATSADHLRWSGSSNRETAPRNGQTAPLAMI